MVLEVDDPVTEYGVRALPWSFPRKQPHIGHVEKQIGTERTTDRRCPIRESHVVVQVSGADHDFLVACRSGSTNVSFKRELSDFVSQWHVGFLLRDRVSVSRS